MKRKKVKQRLLLRSLACPLAWKIWLYRHQTVERTAFLIVVLAAKSWRVHKLLTLCLWHGAEIAEGPGYHAPAILRKTSKLTHGPANLLPLRHGKMFEGFVSLDDAIPLRRAHVVQLREAITHALLSLRWEFAESRFVFQCFLLLGHGEIAMTVHPFGKMFLIPSALRLIRLPGSGAIRLRSDVGMSRGALRLC